MKRAATILIGLLLPALASADELPRHVARVLGDGPEATSSRAAILERLEGAVRRGVALPPDERHAAWAAALGHAVCPPSVELSAEPPSSRAGTLLDECGPFIPPDVDAEALIRHAGCKIPLGAFSSERRRLVPGPGALLLLMQTALHRDEAMRADRRRHACRLATLPALIRPARMVRQVQPDRERKDVLTTVAQGGVRLQLADGAGLRLTASSARAELAPRGESIEIPVDSDRVDARALREAAPAVHALLADDAGALIISVVPATPYSDTAAVIDAVRLGLTPDGWPVPLFERLAFPPPRGSQSRASLTIFHVEPSRGGSEAAS